MAAPKRIVPHDLLLAIGGTEERLQLVLGQPGLEGCTLLTSRQWTVPGQSIRFLIPGLKQALDSFGLGIDIIARIACVRGPGSFTGLRLILAAAEGLAAGQGLPLAGLDYLPLLASGPGALISGPLHVLTYARRGLVYLQSFDAPSLKEHAPLESLSLDEAATRMAEFGDTAHLMGSGLRKNPDFFTALAAANQGYTLLAKEWDTPSPEVLLAAAYAADFTQESIEPVYVRPTDAEDNLGTIAAKRGLDPIEAKKRLEELRKQ
ncbi:tRNA (adenosine(37)-N6)-threonylcarbamoyltransferase complex dimerization subunit type 1 TsaB [Pseudodesulfovibrio nedwellii]|uniref:tRNA (Adenosine(37)-N6)-threonylcarbamoyltransferase complex dimerization subunit type 1 TsaB n=1 Tax=Pseudodesulfovibrio nedwellii TaxID=2973072 RepID=A0ABN6RZZ4_9BACT|nr:MULTISPECIES: tRNA (adenosine(37)-N6)-threonylcarbamoyltransferase complex dimerization subunit type 1 TsaB [Pseudodesulfovibrio]BDQ35642.1 tRNA (adenosine(37)-N6)-threonylcarbamoyltransferase complex dimerization subunit type 1 TsaB [Pseudodesulfovibrio nedwellii]